MEMVARPLLLPSCVCCSFSKRAPRVSLWRTYLCIAVDRSRLRRNVVHMV